MTFENILRILLFPFAVIFYVVWFILVVPSAFIFFYYETRFSKKTYL